MPFTVLTMIRIASSMYVKVLACCMFD